MGVMRDVEIVWDDLMDAFSNPDPEFIYFLDRHTGEVFFVPVDYEDDAFWDEIDNNADQYLRIPGPDYEQERLLIHEFIREIGNSRLRTLLEKSFVGKRPYGKLDEILSFYPEEMERLSALRESQLADRIRHWLEEHDIFAHGDTL
jgi:hypothetical protein